MGKNWKLFLALIVVLICFPTQMFAESFYGYSVSDMIMKVTGKPGDTVTYTYKIFNDTADNATVMLAVRDFKYDGKQIIYTTDNDETFSVLKWSKLDQSNLELKSRESKEITLTVSIPTNAEVGEHVALLSNKFSPPSSNASQVKVETELLPVLYVTVTNQDGTIPMNKVWSLISARQDKLNGGHFYFHVKNEGNVHLESEGKIKLVNVLTNKSIDIEVPNVNLLPNNEKDITASWEKPDLIGIYKATYQFSMDGERFEKGTVYLGVIPWIPIIISLVGILIIIWGIRMYLAKLKKKWLEEATRVKE